MCTYYDTTNSAQSADINTANILAICGVTVLLLIIATVVVILVLVWLKRRKIKIGLVGNTDNIKTATNAAYAVNTVPATSGDNDVDIQTKLNEAYTPTDISGYEPVHTSNDCATYESVVAEASLEYDYPRQEN